MSAMTQDFKYALRLLARSPGFTAVALITLALGIGANTAMFAVVNAVLLKPLPFRESERLMLVHLTRPDDDHPGVYSDGSWSYPKYETFVAHQQVFEQTALFAPRDIIVSGDPEPERIRGEVITEGYPEVLGLQPIRGRTFSREEAHKPGTAPAVLISHSLWARRFGSADDVLGRLMQVNGMACTIVGVLPTGFTGLNGNAEIWVPLATFEPTQTMPNAAQSHSYGVIARRRHMVTAQAAEAATRWAGQAVNSTHPDKLDPRPWGARAASLDASRVDADVRRGSMVLLAAVGFVLLIACVNLANLAGTRALGRGREFAVRAAVGASRGRLMRQCLVEGVILATAGAAAGLIVALAILRASAALLPDTDVFFQSAIAPGTPRTMGAAGLTRIGASMITLDAATAWFTAAVGITTALLISLMPALRVSTVQPIEMLKATGRSATEAGFRIFGVRSTLVVVQIGLAFILLAGAGLMIRSALQLYRTSTGVTADDVMTARVDLPRVRYAGDAGPQFYEQLLERVRAIPGVEAAGLGSCVPVSGGCSTTSLWYPPARFVGDGREPSVGVRWITPDFVSALGVRVLHGRNFTSYDRASQPKVVLVNETAARTLWPNESPLGKRIAIGQGGFGGGAEIVGVVSDVRYTTIDTPATLDVYVPLLQSFQSRVRLFVRSRLQPRAVIQAVSSELRTLDPNLPLSELKTMDERLGDAMWRTRVGAWLLTTFGALALLLTAIGVFGVMAQTVAQRTAEIGIRMALGAQRSDVLRLLLRRAALMTLTGLLLGVLGALGMTSVISGLLNGVRAHDPVTFVSVAAALATVGLLACYSPAHRAMRLDAAVALRND
jgi:putative ABC transport system permease protein